MRHAGRGARFFAYALIPFVALAVLAAGLGYVRLKHGPISLSFLVPPIERSINAVLGNYKARIEDAIVQLTDGQRLEFRLQNVRFAEPDGDVVASSPLAAVEISRAALLNGQLLPSRVELIEPELFVKFDAAGGVALSFTALSERSDKLTGGIAAEDPAPPAAVPPPQSVLLKQIDFGRILRQSVGADAGSATSFLREFGVRDATLNVERHGQLSTWRLPQLAIDLDRRSGQSTITGHARIASGMGSWAVAFHTDNSDGHLTVRSQVRDLVPARLFAGAQEKSLLSSLEMPVAANLTVTLADGGGIASTDADIEIGRGTIIHRDGGGHANPVPVDGGLIKLRYDHARQRIDVASSTLRAAEGSITFTGAAEHAAGEAGGAWVFKLASTAGLLGTSEFGVTPVPLDRLTAAGRLFPAVDELRIDALQVAAGGATLQASGIVSLAADRPGVRIEASSSPMTLETLKAAWPAGLAPKTRRWVGENVSKGEVNKLTFRRETGIYQPPGQALPRGRLSLAIEASNGEFRPTAKLPPILVPRVLIGIENDNLEITVPDGVLTLPSGGRIALKAGRMVSANVHAEPSDAEVTFKAQGELQPVIELLRNERLGILKADLPAKSVDGKVDAQLAIAFPMIRDLPAARVKVSGKAKLTDGRAHKIAGDYDVQGATVGFDFNNGAVEAKGEAIVRSVLARISWQHIFDAPDERQPPLRITAALDNADRKQLGLDINHIVQGEVPVDVQVVRGSGPAAPKVHVRADLTNAEVAIDAIAWRKPPGRAAAAEFDIATLPGNRQELQNFRIAGDNIAVEGWAAMGPDRKLREFYFPDFSINVVTRLKVQGALGDGGVWDIKVRGTTFEAKDVFRSLVSLGRTGSDKDDGGKSSGGLNLDAEVDNVIGLGETSLRALKMKLATRGGKLTALDARGTLDGGAPLALEMDRDGNGQRRIRADSSDAGQAFKLIGFYPNMQKGRVRLELNVDGRGAAEKTGILWVEDFRVLGDPVIAEVVSSGYDDGRPSIGGKKRVVREVFDFDTMRVPFSAGHGQFVMDDAYVRGPLIGATIRGKVDYKTERVNLGGTYIPLQGLNNAFGQIPVLGQILSGPRGEGIFGITFAIQGAMANPQVIVNPLSLVAPGIFREVFQMTNPSPQVQERKPDKPRVRRSAGSSSAPARKDGDKAPAANATIDGWSSDTKKR